MSVGMDPFTPNNLLDYTTRQITDNFRYYMGKSTFTLGASFERFTSNNLFFPVSNGVYTFNSLSDFYTAANKYKANPSDTLTSSTAKLQYRYSALPGGGLPLQKLGVNTLSVYGQVEHQFTPRLTVTVGLRATNISFDETALSNPYIKDSLKFIDAANGYNSISVNTGVLPSRIRILFVSTASHSKAI